MNFSFKFFFLLLDRKTHPCQVLYIIPDVNSISSYEHVTTRLWKWVNFDYNMMNRTSGRFKKQAI